MKWSFQIARVFDIDLKVHVTFFLIVLLGATRWSGYGAEGAVFGAALMLLLFACVVLHEFGHALAARAFGIPVRQIMLLPIGGVAVLARNPSKPLHELLIAAAGPAVNVVIIVGLAAVMALRMLLTGTPPASVGGAAGAAPSLDVALTWLLGMNVALVVFNLIPAFPLDGGRILRGVLGFFMEWVRATRVATLTGQIIAVGMGAVAVLSGNVLLGLIAVMIFLGAGSTHAEEQARTVLATRRVGDAYNKHALTLREEDRVGTVVDHLLTSYQPDFAVLRGGQLVAVVTRHDVLRALSRRGGDLSVGEVMGGWFVKVPADLTLDEVGELLRERQTRVAAVYDGEAFLGLVSGEDIAEANAILSALGGPPEPRRPAPLPPSPLRPHPAGGNGRAVAVGMG